jgi:pimeloyl-ACP methyl ester carboxylesterase
MSKRSWIFLRGLCRGRGHWGDFPELFRQRYPEDEVELIDLPGNGERHQEKSPWKISDYVSLIASQSQFLREGKKVHLLGLSLGAMIAVEWAKQSPEQLAKIYLGVTSSQHSPFYQRMQTHNYGTLLKLFGMSSVLAREKIILHMIANKEERIQKLLPQMTAYSEKYPLRRGNFVRQISAASTVEFPEEPPVPTLLMGSWGDKLVSPECTQTLAKKWKLEARMHAWTGHDIPIDDPQWLIEQLA